MSFVLQMTSPVLEKRLVMGPVKVVSPVLEERYPAPLQHVVWSHALEKRSVVMEPVLLLEERVIGVPPPACLVNAEFPSLLLLKKVEGMDPLQVGVSER